MQVIVAPTILRGYNLACSSLPGPQRNGAWRLCGLMDRRSPERNLSLPVGLAAPFKGRRLSEDQTVSTGSCFPIKRNDRRTISGIVRPAISATPWSIMLTAVHAAQTAKSTSALSAFTTVRNFQARILSGLFAFLSSCHVPIHPLIADRQTKHQKTRSFDTVTILHSGSCWYGGIEGIDFCNVSLNIFGSKQMRIHPSC